MILAVVVADELDAIVRLLRCDVGLWCPGVLAVVGELLGDGVHWNHVGRLAVQEKQRNSTCRGWHPGDVEWLADWDGLVETWRQDGVARRVTFLEDRRSAHWSKSGTTDDGLEYRTYRLGVGLRDSHKTGEEESEPGEVAGSHF